MKSTTDLKLTKKQIKKTENYGGGIVQEHIEVRWFAETGDGFDGTANGYGFKTPGAAHRAYYYFLNKSKFKEQKQDVKKWLNENIDAKGVLDTYFSDWCSLDRAKNGEPTSMLDMINSICEDKPEIVAKLMAVKPLWKSLMKHCLES